MLPRKVKEKMKVLIPTNDKHPTMNSSPNQMMGTSSAFVIYDTNTDEMFVFENAYLDKKECHLSDDLKDLGIDAIVAANVCSPCHGNLLERGIDVWKDDGSVSIREVVNKFVIGGLFLMTEASPCRCPRHSAVVEVPALY